MPYHTILESADHALFKMVGYVPYMGEGGGVGGGGGGEVGVNHLGPGKFFGPAPHTFFPTLIGPPSLFFGAHF
jgi:hypothetical protein